MEREDGNMKEDCCNRCTYRTHLAAFCSKQTTGVETNYLCRNQRRFVLQNMEFSFKTILAVILLTLLLSPVDVECRPGAFKTAENYYAQLGDRALVSQRIELFFMF